MSDFPLCADLFENDSDVLLAAIERDASQPPKYRLAAEGEYLWTAGDLLLVKFLEPRPAVDAEVMRIARIWSQYANINFETTEHSDAHIRISYKGGLNQSRIGRQSEMVSGPSMWLPSAFDTNWREVVVLHEFGHALGCIHEHASPKGKIDWKRDVVLEHYKARGRDASWVEHNVFKRYDKPSVRASEYDRESIMHYPIAAAHVEDPTSAVGWNKQLSQRDRDFIGRLYPRS